MFDREFENEDERTARRATKIVAAFLLLLILAAFAFQVWRWNTVATAIARQPQATVVEAEGKTVIVNQQANDNAMVWWLLMMHTGNYGAAAQPWQSYPSYNRTYQNTTINNTTVVNNQQPKSAPVPSTKPAAPAPAPVAPKSPPPAQAPKPVAPAPKPAAPAPPPPSRK